MHMPALIVALGIAAHGSTSFNRPGGIAFIRSKNLHSGLWASRDTVAYSGTEASMLVVAHGLAVEMPEVPIYVVDSSKSPSVKSEGVIYCNVNDLPTVRIAVFGNEKNYPVNDPTSPWSINGIVAAKKVHQVIFWRQNVWHPYHQVAGGERIRTPTKPALVFNSWFEYYSFHGAHKPPQDDFIATVIPNAVMSKPRNKSAVIDHTKLIYASAPRKGLAQAYSAFAEIVKILPDMRLKVFCPNYARGMNPFDFNQFPLPKFARAKVIKGGSVPKAELQNEIETALAVLYPTQYKETFGNSLVEANAVGTPVIHVATGSLPEVLSNARAQTVSAVNYSTDAARLVDKYRRHGRPHIEENHRFLPNIVVQQWLDFLATL